MIYAHINIEVFGDSSVCNQQILRAKLIENEEIWFEEFLSAKMVVAVVARY